MGAGRMAGMDGRENWNSIEGWARQLEIPIETVRQRLKGVPSIIGKHDKRLADFYREADVRRLCADLLANRGTADKRDDVKREHDERD